MKIKTQIEIITKNYGTYKSEIEEINIAKHKESILNKRYDDMINMLKGKKAIMCEDGTYIIFSEKVLEDCIIKLHNLGNAK